ncbi:clathrin adaptor mu subunit [Suillus subaureus]|uniref:Clathrin adaptor mu subunit n=1 Tax=Suillus subaureus TaxID=48587 RepID=A0A9P7JGA7_9AGAM|nr:clathrin adaptor mu subunit [Suillus subaureus]KAG1820564.1 clathrin adaptor mu subunit [Suillus subaureus]
MAIDGLIILDPAGRPIIQSSYTTYPAAYPLLHIEALNNALAKALREGSVDPVIYIGELSCSSACCHVEVGGMRFVATISGDADPLIAFAFLDCFIEILQDYFGIVSVATLKDNFDIVYQVRGHFSKETLDSSGHPLTTSPNALSDIVLSPSLISKLLASVSPATPGASSFGSNGAGGAFTSPIPWRKAGVRHNHNEILFDIVEDMRGIVGKNGATLVSNVFGKIESNAKLSGTPDLTLTFANPNVMMECAFHPCVRLQKWTRDNALSFVPPEGRFILADYQYRPPQGALISNVPMPLSLKANMDMGEFGGTFALTLTSRSIKVMENLELKFYLGEDATSAQCTLTKVCFATSSFCPKNHSRQTLRWEILNMRSSGSWILRGSWTSKIKAPRPAHAFQIRFEIPSYSFSSLKVDQLRLSSETYKMYKGVRMRSKGSIEWRW